MIILIEVIFIKIILFFFFQNLTLKQANSLDIQSFSLPIQSTLGYKPGNSLNINHGKFIL